MTAPLSATDTQIGIQSKYPHSSQRAPFGDLGTACADRSISAKSGWERHSPIVMHTGMSKKTSPRITVPSGLGCIWIFPQVGKQNWANATVVAPPVTVTVIITFTFPFTVAVTAAKTATVGSYCIPAGLSICCRQSLHSGLVISIISFGRCKFNNSCLCTFFFEYYEIQLFDI